MDYIAVDQIEVMRVGLDEAETCINWMRGDDKVRIFTSDNTTLTKLKRCMAKNPSAWLCYEAGRDRAGYVVGYNFIAPRRAVRLGGGSEKSEEQKVAASERMKARLATGWLPGQSSKDEEDE